MLCHNDVTSPLMFEPVRGGTRGGQAEFKWSDVSADKDREASDATAIDNYPANLDVRIILAIVSMLLQVAGRKIKTFIGTTVM